MVTSALLAGGACAASPTLQVGADGQGTITTYAGGGVGDGGPANQAAVYPHALAVDSHGALYITDRFLARVRKVSGGVITTIAGDGEPGYSGDNGPALQARIGADINGIAIAPSGEVYIVDPYCRCIRMIDTHGIITTAVSDMVGAPGGIAVDPKGNLYVADDNLIVEYPPHGGSAPSALIAGGADIGRYNGDGIPAVAADVSNAMGLAFDAAGNLYIADTGNSRVRRIDAATQIISTVFPRGTGGLPALPSPAPSPQTSPVDPSSLNMPTAVAVGRGGVIEIADMNNNRVVEVGSSSSHTVVSLWEPQGVAADPSTGRVYADAGGHTAVYDQFGYVVAGTAHTSNVVSGGPPSGGWASPDDDGALATNVTMAPMAVAADPSGGLVIADLTRVRRVTTAGRIVTVAGTGIDPAAFDVWTGLPNGLGVDLALGKGADGARARAVNLEPIAVAIGPNGDVYFGDGYTREVFRVGGDGILHLVAGNNAAIGGPGPGNNDGDGGPARGASLTWPGGIAVAPDGQLYISNGTPSGDSTGTVRHVDRAGVITTIAGAMTSCVSSAGTTPQQSGVGPVPGVGDGGPATQACLDGPTGLALDRSGNLYIAETGGNRVRRVDTQGIITTVAGVGSPSYSTVPYRYGYGLFLGDGQPATHATLNQPTGVAVDSAGDVFIADTSNQEVREVDAAGVISTVAGNAQQAYTARGSGMVTDNTIRADTAAATAPPARGDGGLATSAYLEVPVAVALDGKGNLYIADTVDQRIRMIEGAGVPQHRSGARTASVMHITWTDMAIEDTYMLSPHAPGHKRAGA